MPPFWAAAWAREKPRGKHAGPRIISQRSGIPLRTVQRISNLISWTGVDLDVASAFLKACGLRMQKMNVVRQNEVHAYLRWCAVKGYPGYSIKDKPALRPFGHLKDKSFAAFCRLSKQWGKSQAGSTK